MAATNKLPSRAVRAARVHAEASYTRSPHTGEPEKTPLALVEMELRGEKFQKEVAVSASRTKEKGVLYSIPMQEHVPELLLDCARQMERKREREAESSSSSTACGTVGSSCTVSGTSTSTVCCTESGTDSSEESEGECAEPETPKSVNVVTRSQAKLREHDVVIAERMLGRPLVANEMYREQVDVCDSGNSVVGDEVDSSAVGEAVESRHEQEEEREVSESVSSDLDEENVLSLGCPNVRDVSSRKQLEEETKADESLSHCRALADAEKMGYKWDEGLLVLECENEVIGGVTKRLVLPKPRRERVLEIAHDLSGHFGSRKTRARIGTPFHLAWGGNRCGEVHFFV